MDNKVQGLFLFHCPNHGRLCSGVFETKEIAESWIKKHGLSGVLTKYPLDVGVFDWAIENGLFKPKNEKHLSPDFIGSFTSASQEHYHYENGLVD
jgi:hypothetical protein